MGELLTLGILIWLVYKVYEFLWCVCYIVSDVIKTIREAYKRGDFDDWYY